MRSFDFTSGCEIGSGRWVSFEAPSPISRRPHRPCWDFRKHQGMVLAADVRYLKQEGNGLFRVPPEVPPHSSDERDHFGLIVRSGCYRGEKLVLPDRIELSTSPLPMECSTTELRQHARYPGNRPKRPPTRRPVLATRAPLAQACGQVGNGLKWSKIDVSCFDRGCSGPIRFPFRLCRRIMTSHPFAGPIARFGDEAVDPATGDCSAGPRNALCSGRGCGDVSGGADRSCFD
jgi:hypothetical protein